MAPLKCSCQAIIGTTATTAPYLTHLWWSYFPKEQEAFLQLKPDCPELE